MEINNFSRNKRQLKDSETLLSILWCLHERNKQVSSRRKAEAWKIPSIRLPPVKLSNFSTVGTSSSDATTMNTHFLPDHLAVFPQATSDSSFNMRSTHAPYTIKLSRSCENGKNTRKTNENPLAFRHGNVLEKWKFLDTKYAKGQFNLSY